MHRLGRPARGFRLRPGSVLRQFDRPSQILDRLLVTAENLPDLGTSKEILRIARPEPDRLIQRDEGFVQSIQLDEPAFA